MVYDDLIIGSGLTALAVAYGLPEGRRVCVITGPEHNKLQWYDDKCGIPCAYNGYGGLGSYWHGVIPMGKLSAFFNADPSTVVDLFRRFYPESIEHRLGKAWQFVPYRPIRPIPHWQRIFSDQPNWVRVPENADLIEYAAGVWRVKVGPQTFSASRIWIAAGALGTPSLLERSPGFAGSSRKHVSDHVILYLGQLNRCSHSHIPYPTIERSKFGVWMMGAYDTLGHGLLTSKPARFSYARLDHGIEQRAAFGLPIAGLLGKLVKAPSLGLISESLFNKFGLFPRSNLLSVYAQIRIKDAYQINYESGLLTEEMLNIQNAIDHYRSSLSWPELTPSRRTDLFIRGIHIHDTLNSDILSEKGMLNQMGLTIADPSFISDIGPEHHSFKAMVRAYSLAQSS